MIRQAIDGAREDRDWRDKAHNEDRFTNLDGIPFCVLVVIHLLWRISGKSNPTAS